MYESYELISKLIGNKRHGRSHLTSTTTTEREFSRSKRMKNVSTFKVQHLLENTL